MKEKIVYHALRLFDKNGFHGTAMRDIGQAAGCKMPTIYHYFKSKEELFDQIVRVGFEDLVTRLDNEIPKNLSLKEANIYRVAHKKLLTEDERLIYRLALKTWLGFEGCEQSREKLFAWEQTRYEKTYEKIAGIIPSMLWAKFWIRSITNMIQRIILLEEDIADDEIREEISMIYEVATHQNNKNL